MIGYDDPEYEGDPTAAAAELVGYSMLMAEDRKQCPRDDIVTKLVNAQIDGGNLSSDEFGFFVILLAVAGNETTRNAISHGMLAFLDHPDQWELYQDAAAGDRGGRDRPVGHAGDGVPAHRPGRHRAWAASRSRTGSGWACSTGRPTSTRTSSTTRSGSTSCAAPTRSSASAVPARTTAWARTWPGWRSSLMFNAIADAMPAISKAGDAERLRSGWLNGIKRLPVSYR